MAPTNHNPVGEGINSHRQTAVNANGRNQTFTDTNMPQAANNYQQQAQVVNKNRKKKPSLIVRLPVSPTALLSLQNQGPTNNNSVSSLRNSESLETSSQHRSVDQPNASASSVGQSRNASDHDNSGNGQQTQLTNGNPSEEADTGLGSRCQGVKCSDCSNCVPSQLDENHGEGILHIHHPDFKYFTNGPLSPMPTTVVPVVNSQTNTQQPQQQPGPGPLTNPNESQELPGPSENGATDQRTKSKKPQFSHPNYTKIYTYEEMRGLAKEAAGRLGLNPVANPRYEVPPGAKTQEDGGHSKKATDELRKEQRETMIGGISPDRTCRMFGLGPYNAHEGFPIETSKKELAAMYGTSANSIHHKIEGDLTKIYGGNALEAYRELLDHSVRISGRHVAPEDPEKLKIYNDWTKELYARQGKSWKPFHRARKPKRIAKTTRPRPVPANATPPAIATPSADATAAVNGGDGGYVRILPNTMRPGNGNNAQPLPFNGVSAPMDGIATSGSEPGPNNHHVQQPANENTGRTDLTFCPPVGYPNQNVPNQAPRLPGMPDYIANYIFGLPIQMQAELATSLMGGAMNHAMNNAMPYQPFGGYQPGNNSFAPRPVMQVAPQPFGGYQHGNNPFAPRPVMMAASGPYLGPQGYLGPVPGPIYHAAAPMAEYSRGNTFGYADPMSNIVPGSTMGDLLRAHRFRPAASMSNMGAAAPMGDYPRGNGFGPAASMSNMTAAAPMADYPRGNEFGPAAPMPGMAVYPGSPPNQNDTRLNARQLGQAPSSDNIQSPYFQTY